MEKKKIPNPLFLVLSVLSAIPTVWWALVTLIALFQSPEATYLSIPLAAWCGLWTWVWWYLADRYR